MGVVKKLPKPSKSEAWRDGLVLSSREEPQKLVANVLHVFSRHPAWEGVIAYDEFSECAVKLKPPPVRMQDGGSSAGEWSDVDSTRTAAWFASEIGFEPTTGMVNQGVEAAARCRTIHPVRDYLKAQVWDGVARLDTVLATHFGAAATPYTRAVGARWMISAVARVMKPGCQADCMLVLESEAQGIGKSTGFAALFGQAWFSDTGISIGDKDSYQALRGMWGYEFGELDAIKGREVTRVKSFVSSSSDTYRPSYAIRTRSFPRQVIFCGTTNETAYLVDGSGNRRFWPVRCESRVLVENIRRDRDQLWAEALARYESGEPWHVDTPELRELCESEQRDREVEDPWTSIVGRWLSDPKQTLAAAEGLTTEDVLKGALELKPDQMNRTVTTRVGHVMRGLGWLPKQLRRGGVPVRLYFAAPAQLSQPSHPTADSGCDTEALEKQDQSLVSQPSQPDVNAYTHARARGPLKNLILGSDGCDSALIDEMERQAIQAEGVGALR